MESKVFKAKHNGLEFIIKEDRQDVGSYLYVYKEGVCIRDHLQNDISSCKNFAAEEYQVPLFEWKEIEGFDKSSNH